MIWSAVVLLSRPGRGIGYLMCMQPVAWPEPDPRIAAAIVAMYGTRKTEQPLAVLIRDRLGEWLKDEDFAAAFGVRGRPGWSPSRLALVTVLQRAENLTDRNAADAVRARIDWKYLLGLPLDDPGFDHTVLSEFRDRVAQAGLEQVVLDALLGRLVSERLIKAGGKQRTDSTHVVAAVAALNRLELAGESVRAALEALAAAHPAWLEQRVCAGDFTRRYGTPVTSWRPPSSQARRDELAVAYARDGYALLGAVYGKTAPGWLRELPAVDVLRRVLLQNYTRTITTGGREVIRRREKEPEGDGLPPGHARIASPYDTDARWAAKRDIFWLGYKLHITETCDDPPPCTCRPAAATDPCGAGSAAAGGREHARDCANLVFPNLITHVATTDATVTDNQMTGVIHDDLAERNLAPGQQYLDSGYLSAEAVVRAARSHGIALIGPLLADTSAQARAGGYTQQAFTIDWDRNQATCPEGAVSSTWAPMRTRDGKDAISVRFAAATCRACPARDKCTTAVRTGRQLFLRPREIHQALAAARAAEGGISFQAGYARRAGIEGTMHQAASHGARRARYRGLPKTRLDHLYMACALNLLRLQAYWTSTPLDRRRTSHLARLELGLAAQNPN
jgi:transposase